MKAIMLVDLNEHIKKGDAPPKGDEARFVKAGLAEELKDEAPAKAAPKTKKKRK